ncbi:MAG: hypothetical protein KatS3mg104_0557 [Phycisphaerae bacterium]|nr:MAG: hypothetical protein KatS3mg104_0557 [Phycisphaerae bacterium]
MSTCLPDLEWVRARDGSRTARFRSTQRLWGDCSVPRRSAEMMLRSLKLQGRLSCLLLPTHPHQVAVCLEKTPDPNGLIVILESESEWGVYTTCCDFSSEAHRLFFAWDVPSLSRIFEQNPGLPVPQQFIRLPVSDQSSCEKTIEWCQQVFSQVNQRQTDRLEQARAREIQTQRHLLTLVSGRFQLWHDADRRLADLFGEEVVDLDDVRHCASAYIAERASYTCGLLTTNVGRTSQPHLIRPDLPWICWATVGLIPEYVASCPRDGLVVIDPEWLPRAYSVGWPKDRVAVGQPDPLHYLGGDRLVLVYDLPDMTPPPEVVEYSSWRVVWDSIARELSCQPHRLAGDVTGYLERTRRRFGVPENDFPVQPFIQKIVEPAYAMGIARWLIQQSIPVHVWGKGWERVDEIRPYWNGPVENRSSLDQILITSGGLVDIFLTEGHLSRYLGVPILKTVGRSPQRILQEAHQVFHHPSQTIHPYPLVEAVRSLLNY